MGLSVLLKYSTLLTSVNAENDTTKSTNTGGNRLNTPVNAGNAPDKDRSTGRLAKSSPSTRVVVAGAALSNIRSVTDLPQYSAGYVCPAPCVQGCGDKLNFPGPYALPTITIERGVPIAI